jgi:glycosyltransferase involved in cell wall biosynthesis
MLKILRSISSVNPENGGPINGLINSSKKLIEKGHFVDVVSLDDPKADWMEKFEFNLNSFKGVLGSFRYSKSFSCWLDLNIKNYDVVIIHGIWQYHSYTTAKACLKHNIPYVIFTHGMLDPWFNKENKFKHLKKSIYWKLIESLSINNANAVLFTSEEERILAREVFTPYHPVEKVVAYGSSLPKVDVSKAKTSFYCSYPELVGKKFFFFLSRIHQKKGIDILIMALAKIKNIPDDFALVIAGPDHSKLRPQLVQLAKNIGVEDKIHWVGMLEGDVKWGGFYAADVFILPSHQENFGIVVAEALSTKTPVLITNKVNIWQEIQDSNAGLVENDDAAGVECLLNNWLLLNQEQKNIYSENALNCYVKNFSIESAVSS